MDGHEDDGRVHEQSMMRLKHALDDLAPPRNQLLVLIEQLLRLHTVLVLMRLEPFKGHQVRLGVHGFLTTRFNALLLRCVPSCNKRLLCLRSVTQVR